MCNDSKTGSTDSLACRTTDICYKPRHHNRRWVKINEPTVQRRLNEGTIDLKIIELMAHDYKGSKWSSPTRQPLSKEWFGTYLVVRIQLKSMFGVASQVNDSIGSSVLRKLMCDIYKRDLLPTAQKRFNAMEVNSQLEKE